MLSILRAFKWSRIWQILLPTFASVQHRASSLGRGPSQIMHPSRLTWPWQRKLVQDLQKASKSTGCTAKNFRRAAGVSRSGRLSIPLGMDQGGRRPPCRCVPCRGCGKGLHVNLQIKETDLPFAKSSDLGQPPGLQLSVSETALSSPGSSDGRLAPRLPRIACVRHCIIVALTLVVRGQFHSASW